MNDLEPENERKLRDYLRALVRRRKPVIITVATCLVVAVLLTIFLPAYYRSTGTILIEQQEVPQDLVRSTVTSYADQRVQVISQRVMTTQNLLGIIRRYELYPWERKHKSREELIERMRDDIVFKMISADVVDPRSGIPRQATIAFSVSYESRSPEQAVKVANELTTLYLDENLSERTRLAQDATGFLLEEGQRLSARIAELESRLAVFKSQHVDALPELTQVNMQLLDRTEQELRDAHTRRMSLEQQRVFLEAQLAQIKPNSMMTSDTGERILSPADRLKTLKSQLASAQALYTSTHPDIARLKREIAGLEAQEGAQPATNSLLRDLESARGELGQAREKYAPGHPDVLRLEKRVTALESALAAEAAADAAHPAPDAGAPTGERPDNPAYIQLQAQVNAARNDLGALDVQIRDLRVRVTDYQRKIFLSPDVEKEYRQLTRDYESAQLKYQEVRSKQMEAQLAQNLEADRKGERFTLIEPPLPPEEPVSPNRPAVLIIGLVLALAFGAGVVALLEALDETIRGRVDLVQLVKAPVLAVVPRIITKAEVLVDRRRRRFAFGATVAAGIGAILATHLLYRPLDVLWFAALRHFGL